MTSYIHIYMPSCAECRLEEDDRWMNNCVRGRRNCMPCFVTNGRQKGSKHQVGLQWWGSFPWCTNRRSCNNCFFPLRDEPELNSITQSNKSTKWVWERTRKLTTRLAWHEQKPRGKRYTPGNQSPTEGMKELPRGSPRMSKSTRVYKTEHAQKLDT